MPAPARGDRTMVAHALLAAAWLAVPFTVGAAMADALAGASGPVQGVASAGAWLGWAATALAVAVPRGGTLTVVRIAAPAPLAVAAAAAVASHPSVPAALVGGVVLAVAAAPAIGARFVQGSAYGDERRYPLRAPAALWLGPLPLGWLVLAAALTVGPLLVAARQWAAGAAATAAGAAVAYVTIRAFAGLARRFVVFVPAGFVLHDPYVLADPVLFPRRLVVRMGPAAAGSNALDLTAGAAGLALELELAEKLPLSLAPTGWRRRTPGTHGKVLRLLFTPTQPGAVLAEARRRRLPVGMIEPDDGADHDHDHHHDHHHGDGDDGGTSVEIGPASRRADRDDR